MYKWFRSEGYKGLIKFKHFNINNNILNLPLSETGFNSKIRKRYSIDEKTFVFGFLGSIGLSHQWNSIYPYIKHLNSIYRISSRKIKFCFGVK